MLRFSSFLLLILQIQVLIYRRQYKQHLTVQTHLRYLIIQCKSDQRIENVRLKSGFRNITQCFKIDNRTLVLILSVQNESLSSNERK